MNTSMAALLDRIRAQQAVLQAEYPKRKPIGEPAEIPRPGEAPVKTLINRPSGAARGQGRPFFINLHGGGFIEGDALTMGSYCQKLADELDMVVFNVNYRLSPDYVFPSQVEETCAVLDHAMAHAQEYGIDPARGGIGGFSAGATLAAGVAVKRILEGKPGPKATVLGYPLVSFLDEDMDHDSPYPAADEDMTRAMAYFAAGRERDPVCSALCADDDTLRRFPATVLITCGKDSLGLQGERFARRLMGCGATVLYKRYLDAYHGFIEVNRDDYFVPDARKTGEQMALTLAAERLIVDGLRAML